MAMKTIVIALLAAVTLAGCGIIQIKTKKDPDPSPPSTGASTSADPQTPQAAANPQPTSAVEMAMQERTGGPLGIQAKEVMRRHREKQITTCEALAQLRALEQQVPSDIRELYRSTMNLERIPPEGIPGFVRPDQIEAARAATGERRAIIMSGVEMHLRNNTPAQQRGSIVTLAAIDKFRRGTYKRAGSNALAKTGVRTDVPVATLREWLEVFRCLGDFTPGAPGLTGAQIAAIMEDEVTRLEKSRQAQADEEARCKADPKCVEEREIESVLGDLCGYVKERDETESGMKERLKEARKYGVINLSDQNSDLEDKQFLDEMIAKGAEDYRAVTGQKFTRAVCVNREAEMVLSDLCTTSNELKEAASSETKKNLAQYFEETKVEYRRLTGKTFAAAMCKRLAE
jgi:hypothetical protein